MTDFFIFKVDRGERKVIRGTTEPRMIKDVSQTTDEEGDIKVALTALAYDGTEKIYVMDDCENIPFDLTGREISEGDIVRIDKTEYGMTSMFVIDTMYDCVNNEHIRYIGDDTNRVLAPIRVIPVNVIDRQDNHIKYDTYTGLDPHTKQAKSVEITNIASAKVYVFDKERKTVSPSSISRIAKGDNFVMYSYYGVARMIVYYE